MKPTASMIVIDEAEVNPMPNSPIKTDYKCHVDFPDMGLVLRMSFLMCENRPECPGISFKYPKMYLLPPEESVGHYSQGIRMDIHPGRLDSTITADNVLECDDVAEGTSLMKRMAEWLQLAMKVVPGLASDKSHQTQVQDESIIKKIDKVTQ